MGEGGDFRRKGVDRQREREGGERGERERERERERRCGVGWGGMEVGLKASIWKRSSTWLYP